MSEDSKNELVLKASEAILALLKEHLPPERWTKAEEVLSKNEKFFLAPASSRVQYHGCFPGGLVIHTYNVLEVALRLAEALGYKQKDSLVVAAVFHDLGKINLYEGSGKSYKKTNLGLPHSAESLRILAEHGFALSPDEYQAILMHNGLYTPMGEETKLKESQLALIIHWSHMWATVHMEKVAEKASS